MYTLMLISATATAASSMLSAKPVNMEIYQNVGLDCVTHTLQDSCTKFHKYQGEPNKKTTCLSTL